MFGVFKHQPNPFFQGDKGSRRGRRRRRPVLTIAESCRGRAPSEPATVRMPCDLWKVNKGWSTAGLQENREQTRSNTLLLGAAEETEGSQPACESTVDFSPMQSTPIHFYHHRSSHFILHTWLFPNRCTAAFWFPHNKYRAVCSTKLTIHLLCAGEPLYNGSAAALISTKD